MHERDLHRHRAELHGVDHVARERRPAADDLVARLEHRLREAVDDAVRAGADRELLVADAVARRERSPQPVRASVGIAVQLRRDTCHRLQRLGEGTVGPFVRRELDDARKPELALHFLDRLAGLVRNERRQLLPQEAVLRHSAVVRAFLRQRSLKMAYFWAMLL